MANEVSNTTTLGPAVQAFYDKKFLLRAKEELAGYQFAQKKTLPKNESKTIYFSRYAPLTKQSSALDETYNGGLTTQQQLTVQETAATVALWGDYVRISKLADLTSVDPGISEKVGVLGQQAGETMDYEILKTLAAGINRRRADGDSTYQFDGTADSGTTTTLVDALLTQADDFWNGGYVIVTKGTNVGEVRKVTDFDAASDTVTFAAFPAAIDSTSEYRIVVGTNIAAGDTLSTSNVRLGLRDLKRARAMKHSNGYFVCLIDPDVEYDFMGDSDWKTAATYKDGIDALYKGEIGKWFGIRFVTATQMIRETVSGTVSDSGAVHNAIILGSDAYGVVELEGQKNKIYTKTPDQLGQPIPLYGTVGWQVGQVAKALNGTYGVSILCGASA